MFVILYCKIFPNYVYPIRSDRSYPEIEQAKDGYEELKTKLFTRPLGQHCLSCSLGNMRNETYAVRGEEELQVDKPVDIGKRRPDDI